MMGLVKSIGPIISKISRDIFNSTIGSVLATLLLNPISWIGAFFASFLTLLLPSNDTASVVTSTASLKTFDSEESVGAKKSSTAQVAITDPTKAVSKLVPSKTSLESLLGGSDPVDVLPKTLTASMTEPADERSLMVASREVRTESGRSAVSSVESIFEGQKVDLCGHRGFSVTLVDDGSRFELSTRDRTLDGATFRGWSKIVHAHEAVSISPRCKVSVTSEQVGGNSIIHIRTRKEST